MKKSHTKKGSALIIVLLVVAILTTVGVSSIDRLQADISRSTDFSLRMQSHWYALGLESRVSDFIRERQKIRNFSNLLIPDQDIPSILVTIEGGNLEGKLFDLQTCFNLNSVVRLDSQDRRVINQIGVDQYRGLLSELGLDEYSQDQIIYPLVDWLDSDDFVQDINGAEDDFYTRLKSPYRAANQLLYDISELKDIKNYSSKLVSWLSPYVCVIPAMSIAGININAIQKDKPEILVMLMGGQISTRSASNILNDRPVAGFRDLVEFLSHPELLDLQIPQTIKDQILTESNYYVLKTKVLNYGYPLEVDSLISVNEVGHVKVLKRQERVF